MEPPLKHHPMPTDRASFLALEAPIARMQVEGETCIPIGKVFSWSPLHFDIVVLAGERTTAIKRMKDNVHIDPCPHCPDQIIWP